LPIGACHRAELRARDMSLPATLAPTASPSAAQDGGDGVFQRRLGGDAVEHGLAMAASALRASPRAYIERSAADIEESKARRQLAATIKALWKRLPKDPNKLWGWQAGQDQKTMLANLRRVRQSHRPCRREEARQCRGPGFDAPRRTACGSPQAGHGRVLAVEFWQPTAAGHLGRMSKQQTFDAVAEAVGPDAKHLPARARVTESTNNGR
jgi:hypothetical protein